MLLQSIIVASVILLILVMGFLFYKLPNKASYELKTKPTGYHLISGIVITAVGLACLAGCAILMVFDRNGSIQAPLFILGSVIGLAGSIQLFFVLLGFVAIKGDEIHVRLFFKTRKRKISEIKKIRRGPLDFTFYFKDGRKAAFFGVDPILDKIIERKDPETVVEDFVDPRYFWNDPKKMKKNKIYSIVIFALGVAVMTLSLFLSPFDRPVYEKDTVLVTGEFEAVSFTNRRTPDYFFYIKGSDVEYQMPSEVVDRLLSPIFTDLDYGDTITIRVENLNNCKPRREGYAKADRICAFEFNSKQYLTYKGYREGIFKKRGRGVTIFSLGLLFPAISAITFSQTVFFEKARKSVGVDKNK